MAIGLERTGDLLQRSQTMIGQAVGRGTTILADRVEHYTNLAREIGDMLRERGEPAAADLVQTLSERGNDVARYLRTSDGSRLLSDAQQAARGREWLLTGVGFVSGLAIARAVRSSQYNGAWEETPGYVDSYAQPYNPPERQYQQ
jgi:hypothetical protein